MEVNIGMYVKIHAGIQDGDSKNATGDDSQFYMPVMPAYNVSMPSYKTEIADDIVSPPLQKLGGMSEKSITVGIDTSRTSTYVFLLQ